MLPNANATLNISWLCVILLQHITYTRIPWYVKRISDRLNAQPYPFLEIATWWNLEKSQESPTWHTQVFIKITLTTPYTPGDISPALHHFWYRDCHKIENASLETSSSATKRRIRKEQKAIRWRSFAELEHYLRSFPYEQVPLKQNDSTRLYSSKQREFIGHPFILQRTRGIIFRRCTNGTIFDLLRWECDVKF